MIGQLTVSVLKTHTIASSIHRRYDESSELLPIGNSRSKIMLPVLCDPVITISGNYVTSVIYSTSTLQTWSHASMCFLYSTTVKQLSTACRITTSIGFSGYGTTSLELSVPPHTGPLWQDSDVHITESRLENASHIRTNRLYRLIKLPNLHIDRVYQNENCEGWETFGCRYC